MQKKIRSTGLLSILMMAPSCIAYLDPAGTKLYAYTPDLETPDKKFYKLCISTQDYNPTVKLVFSDTICGKDFRSDPKVISNVPTDRVVFPWENTSKPMHPGLSAAVQQFMYKEEDDVTRAQSFGRVGVIDQGTDKELYRLSDTSNVLELYLDVNLRYKTLWVVPHEYDSTDEFVKFEVDDPKAQIQPEVWKGDRWKVLAKGRIRKQPPYVDEETDWKSLRPLQVLSNADYGRLFEHKTYTPKVDLTMSSPATYDPANVERLVLAACKIRHELPIFLVRESSLKKTNSRSKDVCFEIVLTTSKDLVHHTMDLYWQKKWIEKATGKPFEYTPAYGDKSPYEIVEQDPEAGWNSRPGVFKKVTKEVENSSMQEEMKSEEEVPGSNLEVHEQKQSEEGQVKQHEEIRKPLLENIDGCRTDLARRVPRIEIGYGWSC